MFYFIYLENKLGGENPAMWLGENGADGGGTPTWCIIPLDVIPPPPGGDERPGITDEPIEFGGVLLVVQK